ncbi:hypothetical protein [uncultured Pontibacter sp.]|uniref:hypothetical protein n=1 Tax=uncultured Pontibacter sp. TaxID=453356 RepID=UPI00261CDA9F|nr:hypothetical protein [uncultured Pontibacter sp.]
MRLTTHTKAAFFLLIIAVTTGLILSGTSFTPFWAGAIYTWLACGIAGVMVQLVLYFKNRLST